MNQPVKIDLDLRERLSRIAALRDAPVQAVLGEAIQQYVEREEARESFKAEARAARAADGHHMTADDVVARLRGWGSEQGVARPERRD
jgi:predicted transcriptional regulator